MKRFNAAILCVGLCLLMCTSCSETYEYTKPIIGKWELLTIDGESYEGDFTWEFREDQSYTIVNGQGRFEDDPFGSSPFRGSGTYEGFYHVDAPKGFDIREKFRGPYFFSALEIDGDHMHMEFIPTDDDDWVKLELERIGD